MAMGCAVIAAREGGPMEIVEDGVSGILAPPRDPAVLADAIVGLLRDPARRQALGTGARARVEARYARDVYAAELRGLFEEALAGPLP
jgi:glycosyltransferase involved in cell wall biosynthesis